MREKYFNQPSVMSAQQHFSRVPGVDIERSKFDRSHAVKTTFDAGMLIPVFIDEVLPGDTFHLSSTMFSRLATPLRPIMDNIFLDVHYWFVPNRLVWDQWQEFMGERKFPTDDPNAVQLPTMQYAPPTTPNNNHYVGSYFGLPQVMQVNTTPEEISCLPFRAYKLIYNEWYRDQNLVNPEPITTGDYDPAYDFDFGPLRRGKRHDYFTSCLPWPQKGDPVTIPLLGDRAPVFGFGSTDIGFSLFESVGGTGPNGPVDIKGAGGATGAAQYDGSGVAFQTTQKLGLRGNIPIAEADLSDITSVSINDLRTAFQIQRMLERDARGGTRYIELILSHFGVRSDDARLQRPEFLGGGTTRINVNPIASTAAVPEEAPQANLAGVGTGLLNGGFTKSFTEHGFVIGLVSARADLTYQRGIERFWSRKTRYDYYWPSLAHLGEQAVYNKEIYYTGVAGTDDAVFGYQERYAEYRYKPSLVTGQFNSDCLTPLDTWHLAQDFASLPALNAGFIYENPPIDRVIAVPSEPHFLCDIWHDYKCDRPMPIYGVPGLIDHF